MHFPSRVARPGPPPAARLTAVLAAGVALSALAAPDAALAQRSRDRCRYYENGRSYPCEVRRAPARRVARRDHGPFGYESRRRVTLGVGVLQYDLAGRETIPMAALRGDWRLSRFWRGELGVAYAFGDLPATPGVTPQPRVDADGRVRAHVLAPTVGLLAELPTPYLQPYAGAAAGLFARFDNGDDFARPTIAFPVGVRAALSDRVGLRAEVRFRFDQTPGGAAAPNRELTAGLSVGY